MGQGLSPESRRDASHSLSKVKLEKRLEAKLSKEVKKLRGVSIKLPALWYVGIPDRMILLPEGQIYFIELKKIGGRPSAKQTRWIDRLISMGFDARIITGEKELEDLIYEFHSVR